MTLRYHWVDFNSEPQCPSDPRYPNGKDVRALPDEFKTGRHCALMLPHPAKRCGAYIITCDACRLRVAITTAGRADDPRSVELPCKPLVQ